MFENLQDRLSGSLRKISGQARLTDDNIKDTLREVRMALLEADVALPVVKAFIEGVRQRAIGQEVQRSQWFVIGFIGLESGNTVCRIGIKRVYLPGKYDVVADPDRVKTQGLGSLGKCPEVFRASHVAPAGH